MAFKNVIATTVAALNAAVATQITGGFQPTGGVTAVRGVEYPAGHTFIQPMKTGAGVTFYKLCEGKTGAQLDAAIAAEVVANATSVPLGQVAVVAGDREEGYAVTGMFQAMATPA